MSVPPELVDRLAADIGERVAAYERARDPGAGPLGSVARRTLVAEIATERLEVYAKERIEADEPELSEAEEVELKERATAAASGAAALERQLEPDSVEDLYANRYDDVLVYQADGTVTAGEPIAASDEALNELIRQLAASSGWAERRFDAARPWVSFSRGGLRFTAVRQEVAGHTALAVRRHRLLDATMAQLYDLGTWSRLLLSLLVSAVLARLSIILCGDRGTGKSTALRAIVNDAIPGDERIICIEDPRELYVDRTRHRNVLELEVREANAEEVGAVGSRELIRLTSRLGEGWCILGEARGPEIVDMLQAMSQGNASIGTIHSRSSEHAFNQILRYALKAPEHLTPEAVAVDVATTVDLVVYFARLPSGRRVVSSVREVVGFDGPAVVSNEVFAPDASGRAVPTGVPLRDRTLEALVLGGHDLATWNLPDGGWSW